MTIPDGMGLTVGERLRQRRLELGLSLREVHEASLLIAARSGNEEYAISRSLLSNVETRGSMPNSFRLYSVSEIYQMDIRELISWYGVDCFPQKPKARSASAG
jgi:transcriptional regulator with XRE-family HTH domain